MGNFILGRGFTVSARNHAYKRVLWLFRRRPFLAEKQELKKIFPSHLLIEYTGKIRDVDHILQLIQEYAADEIVTILPIPIVAELLERKIYPIWIDLRPLRKARKYDWKRDWKDEDRGIVYRFRGFKRVKGIKLIFEKLI